jgi:hypothetical protein
MFFLAVSSMIHAVAIAVYFSGVKRSRAPIAERVGVCIETGAAQVERAARQTR